MDRQSQNGDSLFPPATPAGLVDDDGDSPRRERRLGERLRVAREHQGQPLDVVARVLHVPLKSLRALEEGTYGTLPADVYARGFVRLYAEYLGLDAVVAMRDFVAERGQQGLVTDGTVPTALRPFRRRRRIPRLRLAGLLGGTLLAVFIVLYLVYEVRGYARSPSLHIAEPPGDIEIHTATITVRGKTDPTAEVRINGERTFVKSDGAFEETLGVSEGVNTIRVAATSVGGKEYSVTREVLMRLPKDDTQAVVASGVPRGERQPGDSLTLTVRADDEPVWLLLRVDKRVAFAGLLLPGSSQTVEGREVHLTSGKANRTRLQIDGEDRGVLGDAPDVVRDAVFTREPSSGKVERR